jgi:hypothetical protein
MTSMGPPHLGQSQASLEVVVVSSGLACAAEPGLPLRVRYSLTPYGMTLVPVLEVLCTWGREHLKHERVP